MPKYIEVNALMTYANNQKNKTIDANDIARFPWADVVERKVGKWIHGREIAREMIGDCVTSVFYEDWKCSECGCIVEEEREPLWNYCPNCGAEMKGGAVGI